MKEKMVMMKELEYYLSSIKTWLVQNVLNCCGYRHLAKYESKPEKWIWATVVRNIAPETYCRSLHMPKVKHTGIPNIPGVFPLPFARAKRRVLQ